MIRLLMLIAALVLLAGCGSESSGEQKYERIYPRILNHKLVLQIISRQGVFYRKDGNPTMRFQLINKGLNPVSIPEWRIQENRNMRVEFAPCAPGKSAEVLEWFQEKTDNVCSEPGRYPLILEPNNSIIIEMPLNFVRSLPRGGNYAVRGVMVLKSLPLESAPVEILVK